MEKHQSIESLEPEFELFEEQFHCRLCVHDYGAVFFRGGSALLKKYVRTSHRKTYPETCGRESRRYCLAHCNDALNRRIAASPPRALFLVHCRRKCRELAAPVYRNGRCILILFARMPEPWQKENFRRLARMLPVFAAGIEARCRAAAAIHFERTASVRSRTEEYIAEHCCEKISTADAAKALFLSVSRLCHLLQEQGTSFSALLASARLSRAKQLMCHSDFSLREIAGLCGYPSYEHFCRFFREQCGIPPSAWRRNHAPAAE